MIATPHLPQITVEEYLDWEPRQEIRHEYWDGEVIAMTGGTIPHNDIALNLYTALRPHVRVRGCRVNVADVKVQVSPTLYFYPDLLVSCDTRDQAAMKLIQFPKLIVEVLSPSTASSDRGDKFRAYHKLSSLQEYVLIDSEAVSVECYRRSERRRWIYEPYTEGDTILLESIEFSCAIDLLYENVTLTE
ncbi:Uma2 family endonuclease [Pantanalinema rosaneae CENA516]|uniref:Uma2 family endonuclease n=1 Tax=Pantanalinema rosaneae TaxID=1620701 RepID=UPI003D6EFA44